MNRGKNVAIDAFCCARKHRHDMAAGVKLKKISNRTDPKNPKDFGKVRVISVRERKTRQDGPFPSFSVKGGQQ